MELEGALLADVNAALNEATLLNVRRNREPTSVDVMLRVLTLPEEGPEPSDRRVVLRLARAGRVAISLRMGSWDDEAAEVVPVELADVSDLVVGFGAQPIYGWELIREGHDDLGRLEGRLSCDERFADGSERHCIELFQEDLGRRHLDLLVWFGDLRIYDMEGRSIALERFAADGRRWWDALFAGDPRTVGHRIAPLRSD